MRITLPLLATALLSVTVTPALRAQCDVRIPSGAPVERRPSAPAHERGGGPLHLIPTVVHMHYGGGLAPLGPRYIESLIERCNSALRATDPQLSDIVPAFEPLIGDMRFELRLATRDADGDCMSGIRYHAYDPFFEAPDHAAATMDTRGYLNIHIGANQSFATLPAPVTNPYDHTDVIMFGISNALYDRHTLAHEVGHWAGLYHVWGLSNATGTCGDDFIADTPITAGSPLDCVTDRAECTPGVVENVQNIMDYSSCRVMFTQGQAAHALDVLSDPSLVRHGLVTEANLLATGVTDPSSCPITAGIYHHAFLNCTGSTVRFRAMAEHALVDSVRWSFSGGNPATSADEHVEVMYTTGGNYPVQLIAYGGGGSAVVNTNIVVDVPSATTNGLAVVSEFPFEQGFEDGFELPNTNMHVEPSSDPSWQPFADAGFASERCLYVPSEPLDSADTNDIVLGNFDFSTLNVPTVQVKVSSSMYAGGGWSELQLLFRDLCSNIFVGAQWAIWPLNEFGADHGMAHVPDNDEQWVTLQASFPQWNLATGAELKLRLVRPAGSAPAEPVYLDDLYVGELPVVTAVREQANTAFELWPNPANGHFTVNAEATDVLHVYDARGQHVWQQRVLPGTNTVDAALAPGVYLVRMEGAAQAVRVMLER